MRLRNDPSRRVRSKFVYRYVRSPLRRVATISGSLRDKDLPTPVHEIDSTLTFEKDEDDDEDEYDAPPPAFWLLDCGSYFLASGISTRTRCFEPPIHFLE